GGVDTTTSGFEVPEVKLRARGNAILPYAFPITVCEAHLVTVEQKAAWSNASISFDGISPNAVTPTNPKRFLLMADTGMRVKPSNEKCHAGHELYGVSQCPANITEEEEVCGTGQGSYQALDEWHFATVLDHAFEEQADVVVMAGDYLYRQGVCPEVSNVSCVAINGPPLYSDIKDGKVVNFVPGTWGDNLAGWWADFFYPAINHLRSIPFIAPKGNHEDCSRGGHGYMLLLAEDDYPEGARAGDYCEGYNVGTFHVPFKHEQFLSLDDSLIEPLNQGIDHFNFTEGACPAPRNDSKPWIADAQTRLGDGENETTVLAQIAYYKGVMETLYENSLSHDTNFYVAHRPIFGIACNGDEYATLDWTIQNALQRHTLDRVSGLINGHMHWSEALEFQDNELPAQIVVVLLQAISQ
ncbi:hypothetical protein ACHAXR_002438, partial [Thalassiosira sp. AJA248-18]